MFMMMHAGMCTAHKVAWSLIFIGAINWGLIGIFDYNLVNAIFNSLPAVERVIYAAVGLAAVFSLFSHKCSMCKASMKT